jgi:hypothetical protein
LVIPDNTMGGLLKESPYAKWKGIVKNTHHPVRHDTFHLNIAGAVFDIDYSDWWLSLSNQSCVQKAPEGFGGILVGDVLFRRYLVLFDLRFFCTHAHVLMMAFLFTVQLTMVEHFQPPELRCLRATWLMFCVMAAGTTQRRL